MRYTVFVMMAGGNTRFDLTKTDDADKASELVSILVSAASGVSLEIGVDIQAEAKTGSAQPAGGRRAAAQTGAVQRAE